MMGIDISTVKINEYDEPDTRTENFEKESEIMKGLSVADIVRALALIDELASLVSETNTAELLKIEDVRRPLSEVTQKCKTERTCLHCNAPLYLSDLPQYDYVCPACDENF